MDDQGNVLGQWNSFKMHVSTTCDVLYCSWKESYLGDN